MLICAQIVVAAELSALESECKHSHDILAARVRATNSSQPAMYDQKGWSVLSHTSENNVGVFKDWLVRVDHT